MAYCHNRYLTHRATTTLFSPVPVKEACNNLGLEFLDKHLFLLTAAFICFISVSCFSSKEAKTYNKVRDLHIRCVNSHTQFYYKLCMKICLQNVKKNNVHFVYFNYKLMVSDILHLLILCS